VINGFYDHRVKLAAAIDHVGPDSADSGRTRSDRALCHWIHVWPTS
jgi:hypothetical protein